jgi:putative flavoprotein involved in K+ transport
MPQRDVVVIGAGQAGLATGYYLKQSGTDFVILDGATQVGASWARRWNSLRLFTPAQYDGLPGLPFPGAQGTFPTKDEMAAYLRRYAAELELPVELGKPVRALRKCANGYVVDHEGGAITARAVVVATGASAVPRRPACAASLDPAIQQMHSSAYRGPSDIPDGDVLVVGGGTSGVEIAIELAATHRVSLAGRLTPKIPDFLLEFAGGAVWWWFITHVLTIRTPIGRRVRRAILAGSGAPLIRTGAHALDAAGVTRVPRVAGVELGRPVLADGHAMDVRSVVWATGFRPDFSWIDFDVTDPSGWLGSVRGVSMKSANLYCVGLQFQFGLTSALVGGVGRDAAWVSECVRQALTSSRSALAPAGVKE